jgi:hypothetical protein
LETRVVSYLEMRVSGVIKAEDATELERKVSEYIAARAPGLVRFLVDAIELKVFAPDAADQLLKLMQRNSGALDRAAFVATSGTTAALQLGRMIQAAGNPKRRLFHSVDEARGWLGEA